jgi:hypothetical protein
MGSIFGEIMAHFAMESYEMGYTCDGGFTNGWYKINDPYLEGKKIDHTLRQV